MYTCYVISPWTGSGTRHDSYRPLFLDTYVPPCEWQSLGGEHTDPTCTIFVTVPDQATADLIEADATYSTYNWTLITP